MSWNLFSEKDRENSSPYIYNLLDQASGITKELVDAALNGDGTAQGAITQWTEYQKTRAKNAEVVFSTLAEGTTATAQIAEAESKFLATARDSLTKIASSWASNRVADQEVKQSIELITRRTANALALGQAAHQKALGTMNLQHQANLRILDITAQAQSKAISEQVTKEQVKTLPGGGALLKLGQRLGNWMNKIIEG
ncbi:MAG: hypothetical protein KME29_31320 [Calothrix sp. FI2-JRJ7]|jgi:hypothetical protein|nr:hypothetical protein [Calothrix sp. FI2-JRJ7]